MARTATIDSTIAIKINIGNFESLDISKTIKLDIEFDSPETLAKKQAGLDKMLIDAVKSQVETVLSATGRKRMTKDKEVELWGA